MGYNEHQHLTPLPAENDHRTVQSWGYDDAYLALDPLIKKKHPKIETVENLKAIDFKPSNSAGFKFFKSLAAIPLALTGGLGCICAGKGIPVLIPKGQIGLSLNAGVPEFLPPGWHWLLSPLRSLENVVKLTDARIEHSTRSIITVPPGYIGYAEDGGTPIVLGPGIHQWDSETIKFIGLKDIAAREVQIGPYTLITVPEGECAVTNNNGVLEILGAERLLGLLKDDEVPFNRSYLLDHAKWNFSFRLATTEQFDPLKSAALLTNDRVEVDLESTVAWRIIDPVKAAKQGGGMDKIRNLVHREARATVADMILSTKISTGIKAPTSKAKVSSTAAVGADSEWSIAGAKEDPAIYDTSDIMGDDSLTSGGVSATAVDACSKRLERIGVHVDTINIVQLDIQDRAVRDRLSQAAVISTKVQESSAIAKTEAKNMEVKAAAEAQTTRIKAQAQADSVTMKAEAEAGALKLHASAAKKAGDSIGTCAVAAQMEEVRVTGDAIREAKATLFLPEGGQVANLLAPPL